MYHVMYHGRQTHAHTGTRGYDVSNISLLQAAARKSHSEVSEPAPSELYRRAIARGEKSWSE